MINYTINCCQIALVVFVNFPIRRNPLLRSTFTLTSAWLGNHRLVARSTKAGPNEVLL